MTNDFIKESKVFIVDDSPANIDLLSDYLDRAGFDIFIAMDGHSAIRRIKDVQPDIILLDVMMPDIDGFETCVKLKSQAETKDIPIIFLTALTGTQEKVKGFEVGAVDYVTKPVQYEEVLARVTTHLTIRNQQKVILAQRNDLETKNKQLQHLNNRFQDQLQLAHTIQQNFLQPNNPNWVDIDMICYNNPANEVSGDLYAYYAFEESRNSLNNKYAVVVGDVSGKGLPAALLMSVTVALLRELIKTKLAPRNLLAQLNSMLSIYTSATKQNCALLYVEIIPPAKYRPGCLQIVNAGGIPPYIKRHNGSVELLEVTGFPLGLDKSFNHQLIETNISTEEMVILISDGVIEAKNAQGEMYGFNRFEEAIKLGPANNAQAMLNHLVDDVMNFVGEAKFHDDVTVVVMKF